MKKAKYMGKRVVVKIAQEKNEERGARAFPGKKPAWKNNRDNGKKNHRKTRQTFAW